MFKNKVRKLNKTCPEYDRLEGNGKKQRQCNYNCLIPKVFSKYYFFELFSDFILFVSSLMLTYLAYFDLLLEILLGGRSCKNRVYML